jgi:CDP-glucose 4,6-dehydratase
MDWVDYYQGRSVLVTGHTGFKGGWLTLWLRQLGARVAGVALEPNEMLPYPMTSSDAGVRSHLLDVRNFEALRSVFETHQPEIVFHLAAQPLVRRSYRDPIETYSTNVMGTVHVLEAVRRTPSVRALVNVTSDKCYENREWISGYREEDALGGRDPYSSSKAACELVTAAYRASYFTDRSAPAVATARAGNVIGGGDWGEDRLVPDIVRAITSGQKARLRNPDAVRPWQHVLEPVRGYLLLGARLAGREGWQYASAWNFGPSMENAVPVRTLVAKLDAAWPGRLPGASPAEASGDPPEARVLRLDVSKAHRRLGFTPLLNLDESVALTVDWYRECLEGSRRPDELTGAQIATYAERLGVPASGGDGR